SPADIKALYDESFDTRKVLETYYSPLSAFRADSFIFAYPYVQKIFSGDVRGGTLLEMSLAPFLHWAVTASDHFTEAYFACPSDKAIEEVQMWMKNEPGCFDITDILKNFIALIGSGLESLGGVNLGLKKVPLVGSLLGTVTDTVTSLASGVLNEIQIAFRRQVKRVLRCNFMSSNPVAPNVLPPVDCLALSYSLEYFATDETSYSDALGNVSPLLKKGGYLMMYAFLGATFYKVGDVTFPLFCLKEDFLRKTLIEKGYNILESHILKRKTQGLYNVCDVQSFIILKAKKERDM
ncbi:nicotinamide N-methyltransferase-like, partial [Lissotriton helveticus]